MKSSAFLESLRSPWLRARSLDLLACALVLSVAAVLLSNNVGLPDKVLYRAVLPALILVLATRAAWFPLQTMTSLRRGVEQTSLIALVAIVYIAVLVIDTHVNRHNGPGSGFRVSHYLRLGFGISIYLVACAYAAADPRRLRAMLIAIGALIAVHAAINIVKFVNAPAAMAAAEYRLLAVFGTPLYRNATHVAPLAAMFGMALMALAATARLRLMQQVLVVPCVLVLTLAVFMAQARGAIIAVIACALLVALISRGSWRAWSLGLSAAPVAAVILFPSVQTALFARADSFRLVLWKSYLKLAAGQPWSGVGLNREVVVTLNGTTFEQPHNAFVWAALRGGAPAGLLAAVMVVLAVYWSYRYWRITGNAALLVLMIVLGLTSATEIGFMVMPYNWIWLAFWLPIGLAAGAERAVRQQFVPAALPLARPRYAVRRMNVEIVVDRVANSWKISVARTRNDVHALPEQTDKSGN